MSNFRISINLCLWFHDHRHRARIFINDDIHTIGDLEKRIENIFKIKNFHLTSQNEYLPSSEDVRILQKDDIVWVMQNNFEQECIPKITPTVIGNMENVVKNKKRLISVTEDYTEQDCYPAKKKKKKKHAENNNEYLSPPKEPKKKKKHKDIEYCTRKDQVNINKVEEVVTKDKKIKKKNCKVNASSSSNTLEEDSYSQDKSSSININKLLPVLHSHINSYNKKVKNKMNETDSGSVSLITSSSPLVTEEHNSQSQLYKDGKEEYKCKGTLPSYKKKVSVPTVTDKYLQEKKVNIVKIEYLSGGPALIRELELTKSNGAIKHENQNDSTSRNTDTNQNSTISTPEKYSANNSENHMDLSITTFDHLERFSTETEESNANQNNASTYDSACIKLIPNNIKTPEEKTNRCTNETEALQINNKSLNSTNNEKEVINTDPIINTSLVINSNESLKLSQLRNEIDQSYNELKLSMNSTKTSRGSSLINTIVNEKRICINEGIIYKSLNNEKERIINKSIEPFFEEQESCKLSSCDTVQKISINQAEMKSSSENTVKELLNNTQSKVDDQNLEKTGSDISIVNLNVTNVMENSCKNLQQIDTSDLNNFTNKTDMVNENVSSMSQKEFNDGQKIINETTDSTDNNKDSDIDLIEDVSKPLSDASILSCHRSSTFSRKKKLSGIGQLLGELRNSESLVAGDSMDSDHSDFVTKRHRKRIRKRKKKNNTVNNTSLSDSSITVNSDYVPEPVRSRACPSMHLKFEEENGEILKVVDLTKNGSWSGERNESYVETSGIENITIDSDVEQSNFENFTIKEEYILKSPSIKNLLPKVGDIIAFKILRITENYTPDMSPYIIGKVTEVNNESKIVLYEILNGIEHCKEPKGILSLEEADESGNNNMREFVWANIIDPRLLFP